MLHECYQPIGSAIAAIIYSLSVSRRFENHLSMLDVFSELSNAFNSIPHSLLLAKLNAYGISLSACSYVQSYLSNRKHRVKIAHTREGMVCDETRSAARLIDRSSTIQYFY